MNDEYREIIVKKIKEVKERWENIFSQEVQQKIDTVKTDLDELRKTFKKEFRRFEGTDR
jgi:hypothetical protein